MVDGVYQSVMSFFIPFIFVVMTTTAASNGLDIAERTRLGCYIAHPAIFTINAYILINTYRWDWLMIVVVLVSDVFIFFWTGVYTAFTYAGTFFEAAPQVYQELTFWMCLIVTPVICLLPRVTIKCIQKQRFPYDVDIIREQAKLGMYADADAAAATNATEGEGASAKSSSSSGKLSGRSRKTKHTQYASVDEDRRPIYPPSIATHNTRTQNGSDGTTYIMQSRASVELQQQQQQQQQPQPQQHQQDDSINLGMGEEPERVTTRQSIDRCRPSYDRVRRSMDGRVRPSFEASNDFTSAARLSRIESTHSSQGHPNNGQRRFNLTTVRKRGLSAFSKKSIDP
jgi:phospholipid-translocating ATPase